MAPTSPWKPSALLAVSGSLLYLLTKGPPSLQDKLLQYLPASISIEKVTKYVKWLFILSAAGQVNSLLSAWAHNNWLLHEPGEKFGANGWDKEVVVITGGSMGIGKETIRRLQAKGMKVANLDITEPTEELPNVHFFKCDVTCVEDIQVAAKAVNDFLGPPTVLINNAGIAHAHTILNSTPQYLRKLFDINVISHYYLVQAFLPDMIKHKKGHIVTLASLASFVGPPGLIDYAASKAAVLAFHEGLHSELKHRYNAPFIKTTVVQPIYVRTALIESWQTSLKGTKALLIQPSTVARAIVDQIVSGRSGQICLPRWMGIAGSLIRAMPWWMQETIRDDMKNDARESAVGQKPGV